MREEASTPPERPDRPPSSSDGRTQRMRTNKHKIYTAEYVESWLEEAGGTIMMMDARGCFPAGHRSFWPDILREFSDLVGVHPEPELPRLRPTAAQITRAEEALQWLLYIQNIRNRRIVAARMLVRPETGRHVFSWRKLGEKFRASHDAAQRWYRDGLLEIASAISCRSELASRRSTKLP